MADSTFQNVLAPYLTVQEIANDGSDISVHPATDYRRLFLGEDGQLHAMDSSGTVTALTGSGAALASGYNNVDTDETTTSSSFGDLATSGPAVTITVNTKVKVTLSADAYGTASGANSTGLAMGCALSGANTVAADDKKKLVLTDPTAGSSGAQASRVLYYSGLTPGSTTFTAKYYRQNTGTAHARFRQILVECMD